MKVICFGDSNTFGYDPRSPIGERYAADSRWVDILADMTGWEVRNNGMNGREIPQKEVIFSKSADFLIVMLGTNDLLQGNSVDDVSRRMKRFLNQLSIESNKTILIAPPALKRGEWIDDSKLITESTLLAQAYRTLSKSAGVHFADANEWHISIAHDGVHFTEDGHKAFAAILCRFVKETFNQMEQ